MLAFVDILILKDKTLGCVSCDDFAHGRRLFDVLTGDGERHDVEGGVVVHLAHGREENCEEGEDDHQHCIGELLDSHVSHHRDLSDEKRHNNSGMDVWPHAASALKFRNIHLQSLQRIGVCLEVNHIRWLPPPLCLQQTRGSGCGERLTWLRRTT